MEPTVNQHKTNSTHTSSVFPTLDGERERQALPIELSVLGVCVGVLVCVEVADAAVTPKKLRPTGKQLNRAAAAPKCCNCRQATSAPAPAPTLSLSLVAS